MIDPLIGQTLGQYELQDRLGRGGMAAVYRAVQPTLGRAVAVKVLPLAQLPDPTLPERFRREARMAANLMHPNIVPVYDFGEWQGYLFIVMALVAGGTLKDRMQRADARGVGGATRRPGGRRARVRSRPGHLPPRRQADERPARPPATGRC